jgi:hypothetical protein
MKKLPSGTGANRKKTRLNALMTGEQSKGAKMEGKMMA